jgi:hypothetical protein
MTDPRGIRNNNPGNIDYRASSDPWLGLDSPPSDGRFCRFTDPVYGLRAILKVLMTYQRRYGLKTVRQLISRWAPPGENDTESYVQDVASYAGVGPDDEVDVTSRVMALALLSRITHHENGVQPYPVELLDRAVDLAKESA